MDLSNAPESVLQYSLTGDDIVEVYDHNSTKDNKGWGTRTQLFILLSSAAFGLLCLPNILFFPNSVPPWRFYCVLAIVFALFMQLWVGRSLAQSTRKQLETKVLANIEPASLLHNTLQITQEALIEETPLTRSRFSWNNSFEIRPVGENHTQILIGNGLRGTVIVAAKGVESGDYQDFLRQLQQRIAKTSEPAKVESQPQALLA